MARKKMDGRFTVVGPMVEPRAAVDVDHGISVAQTYATSRLELEGEYVYEVQDLVGNVRARVTKLEGEAVVETVKLAA